jgi:site-specific DNA-methyltransferase (adenine-specific)
MSYTLYHGDCLEVMRGLDAGSVDCILVDPPYGIDYQSAWRIDKAQWKPKISNDENPFLGWGKIAYRLAGPAGCILVFHRWDVQQSFHDELAESNWIVKSQIIWNKGCHGMGDLNGEFAPMHENILFARKNSFCFPGARPKTILSHMKVSPEKLVHPNEKPVSLLRDLIKSVTNPGETVLDFCMGSGSTGVACAETGRAFVGIELDSAYFAIAQERVEKAYRRAAGMARQGKASDFDNLPMFTEVTT